MSRAAALGSGAVLVLSSCSSAALYGGLPAYGGPTPFCGVPFAVDVDAPCGFIEITTTCTGASATCSGNVNGISTSCSIGPFTADCSISITLGDLTNHTIDVTVDPNQGDTMCGDVVTSPTTTVSFLSGTCNQPVDAGSE